MARFLSYVLSPYTQVEAAYDVVLMRSLVKRSQGEVSDNRVKYADVLSPGATVKQNLPPWARDLTTKLPPRPAFETPDNETLTQCGIALGVLTALTLAQGCSQVSFSSSHLKLLWFMIHIHILTLIYFPCLAASWCRQSSWLAAVTRSLGFCLASAQEESDTFSLHLPRPPRSLRWRLRRWCGARLAPRGHRPSRRTVVAFCSGQRIWSRGYFCCLGFPVLSLQWKDQRNRCVH